MKMVSFGIDISDNDISCSDSLIANVKNDLKKVEDAGAEFARLSNVTGDDIVITAFIKEDKYLESVNKTIYDLLKANAEGFDDLEGVSQNPDYAGEGISYVEAQMDDEFFPDAIIVAFDTYCGERFVDGLVELVLTVIDGMEDVGQYESSLVKDTKLIPGVGYVSKLTDDPVIIIPVYDVNKVGLVAGAIAGLLLAHPHTYMVSYNTPANVLPGSVIFSITALMSSNVIDLSKSLDHKMRILKG